MPDRNKIYDIASLRDYARYAYNVSNGAWLAKSVEHETLNLRVVGSSPTLSVPLQYCLNDYLLLSVVLK